MRSDVRGRRVLPAGLTSVIATGLGITINLATEWKSNAFAWLGVAALTAVSFGVSLWLTPPSVPDSGTTTALVEVRSGRVRTARSTRYETAGLHLELIEENESGGRVFMRAYTEESARILIESRRPGGKASE